MAACPAARHFLCYTESLIQYKPTSGLSVLRNSNFFLPNVTLRILIYLCVFIKSINESGTALLTTVKLN